MTYAPAKTKLTLVVLIAVVLTHLTACQRSRLRNDANETAKLKSSASPLEDGPRRNTATSTVKLSVDAGSQRDQCESYSAVVRGLPLLDSDKAAAGDWLSKAANLHIGQAALGYIALTYGDEAGARRHLGKARDLGAIANPSTKDLWGEILAGVRAAADASIIEPECARAIHSDNVSELIPCTIFEKHSASALDAFAAYYGSSADLLAHYVKARCAKQFIQTSAPERASAIIQAWHVLAGAPFEVVQSPDGTMWIAVSASIADALTDAILAPDVANVALDPPQKIDDLRKLVASRISDFDSRIEKFERVRTQLAPIVGEGLCAIASSRGFAMSVQRCKKIALNASARALILWISAVTEPN